MSHRNTGQCLEHPRYDTTKEIVMYPNSIPPEKERHIQTITDTLRPLGPGVSIAYLAEEAPGEWHCELLLPEERYTVRIVTTTGDTADTALQNTADRAVTFKRETE